ncbi:MAG: phenylacetate--CoA ligase family protein [Desulfobacterales bacterium]|nr:phenylacetate--CoA ligase family protein [Desulfobacterales bacterium]
MVEDYLRNIRKYYYNMPQKSKYVIGSIYARLPNTLKLGRSYIKFQKLLCESRNWTKQQIADYQLRNLKKTLNAAYNYVPYYKKKFNEYGVNPDKLKSIDDIKYFPTLTKKDIKNNYNDLISNNIPKSRHLVTTTGGSTSEPIRFLQEKGVTRSKERAFIFDGWSRVGYSPRAKAVQLKGRSVGNPDKKIFWEYEPIQNFLEMDSNYLTEENIPLYLDAIKKFYPKFIIGYPSSIYLIAKYIRALKDEFIPIQAVFLASENVYPWQRQLFQEVFGCRIFSHYGHSEMVLLGMECEDTHDLHFFPEYGFLEVLDSRMNPVTDVGKYGELVGTSFHNYVMPLIRYKTQDLGIIGGRDCPCGRKYPIIKDVEGRLQEFIVTADNRLISVCVMGAAHFDVLDYVYETQYYQDTPGKLIFNVVPKSGFNAEHKILISKSIKEKVGSDIDVEVKEVENIVRTKSGKHLMIDQKISLNILEGSQNLVLKENS